MPNLYCDLDTWETAFSTELDLDAINRQELEQTLDDASRDVDIFCRRHFYSLWGTFTFDGDGSDEIILPDLLTVGTVKEDLDANGTFEEVLSASDYRLYRPDAPRPYEDTPRTRITVNVAGGNYAYFPKAKKVLEMGACEWGFSNAVEAVAVTVQGAGGIDATATALTVSDGTKIGRGQTLKIEAEQMYVSEVVANIATVKRAMNGTAGATHAIGTAISRFTFATNGVRRATMIQAIRLWKRREVGFIDREFPSPFTGLDADAKRLVMPLKRYDIG